MALTAIFGRRNRSHHQCHPENTYVRNKMVEVVVPLNFTCHVEIKETCKIKEATGIPLDAVGYFLFFVFARME